jgi:hypothetical protein
LRPDPFPPRPALNPIDPTQKITLATKLPDAAKSKLCPNGGQFALTLASAGPAAATAAAAAPAATRRKLQAVAAAPALPPGLAVLDGLASKRKIGVVGWEQTCGGGAVLFIDAVPQGCEFPVLKAEPSAAEGAGAAGNGTAPQNGAGAARAARAAVVAAVVAAAAAAVAL